MRFQRFGQRNEDNGAKNAENAGFVRARGKSIAAAPQSYAILNWTCQDALDALRMPTYAAGIGLSSQHKQDGPPGGPRMNTGPGRRRMLPRSRRLVCDLLHF